MRLYGFNKQPESAPQRGWRRKTHPSHMHIAHLHCTWTLQPSQVRQNARGCRRRIGRLPVVNTLESLCLHATPAGFCRINFGGRWKRRHSTTEFARRTQLPSWLLYFHIIENGANDAREIPALGQSHPPRDLKLYRDVQDRDPKPISDDGMAKANLHLSR